MFYAYSFMISTFPWPIRLSNFILNILLFKLVSTLVFLVSLYSFMKSHIQGQDEQLELENDYERTIHNEVQEKYGYPQDL